MSVISREYLRLREELRKARAEGQENHVPQLLTRHYFEVYVEQIINAAGGKIDNYEAVASLMREFQMKARRDGRHDLIDAVKQTLNACDDRLQPEQ